MMRGARVGNSLSIRTFLYNPFKILLMNFVAKLYKHNCIRKDFAAKVFLGNYLKTPSQCTHYLPLVVNTSNSQPYLFTFYTSKLIHSFYVA